jgi:hypothetical protein
VGARWYSGGGASLVPKVLLNRGGYRGRASFDTSGVQGGGAVGLLDRRMKQETLRRRTSDKDSM